MAGSLAPVIYWAVCTTFCSALRSDAEQLPYQAVMQPASMLSDAVVEPFEDLGTYATSLHSPEGEKVLSCPLLGVFGPRSLVGDVDTKELETLDPLHYSPIDVNFGPVRPAFCCSPRSAPLSCSHCGRGCCPGTTLPVL